MIADIRSMDTSDMYQLTLSATRNRNIQRHIREIEKLGQVVTAGIATDLDIATLQLHVGQLIRLRRSAPSVVTGTWAQMRSKAILAEEPLDNVEKVKPFGFPPSLRSRLHTIVIGPRGRDTTKAPGEPG